MYYYTAYLRLKILFNAVFLPLLISSCNNNDKKDETPAETIIKKIANDNRHIW